MAQKKFVSPLMDTENVQMVEVPAPDSPSEQGMTVEDAYRHLAGMPPEPEEVEEEQ